MDKIYLLYGTEFTKCFFPGQEMEYICGDEYKAAASWVEEIAWESLVDKGGNVSIDFSMVQFDQKQLPVRVRVTSNPDVELVGSIVTFTNLEIKKIKDSFDSGRNNAIKSAVNHLKVSQEKLVKDIAEQKAKLKLMERALKEGNYEQN